MNRYAAIDIGTNSVLLLVAERIDGRWKPVVERAELTRLGKDVNRTKTLAADVMENTIAVVARFADEARALGTKAIVVSATSAARDASNGPAFVAAVNQRAHVTVEILPGDEEARLSFASAHADFGGTKPLIVIDIGGGSTEFIYGDTNGGISYRHSFDVGAVRLTEMFVKSDPPAAAELDALRAHLVKTFSELPAPPGGASLIGVAGTVTTVFSVAKRLEPYDATKVHGAQLARDDVKRTITSLAEVPLERRKATPGLQPKRADVIVAGGFILLAALERLGVSELTVSDRGLRWGLLADRFGRLA